MIKVVSFFEKKMSKVFINICNLSVYHHLSDLLFISKNMAEEE